MGKKKYYTPDVIAALRDPRIAWAANAIGISYFNSSNDVRAARDYLNRVGGTPWERSIRDANNRTNDLINQMNIIQNDNRQRLNDINAHYTQRIQDITNANNQRVNDIFAGNEQRIRDINNDFNTRFTQQEQRFDRRYGQLNDRYEDLGRQYEGLGTRYEDLGNQFGELTGAFENLGDQYAKQGAQLEETTGLYRAQTRLANNKARASVPAPVQSAISPVSGDSRQDEALGRRRRDNTLSSLTILSGLGATGAGAPGLQIA